MQSFWYLPAVKGLNPSFFASFCNINNNTACSFHWFWTKILRSWPCLWILDFVSSILFRLSASSSLVDFKDYSHRLVVFSTLNQSHTNRSETLNKISLSFLPFNLSAFLFCKHVLVLGVPFLRIWLE